MKNSLTPAGIEPATSRFITQHLTTVPPRSSTRRVQSLFPGGKASRACDDHSPASSAVVPPWDTKRQPDFLHRRSLAGLII